MYLRMLELAEMGHAGQKRQGGKEDYINHPRRIAAVFKNWFEKTLAIGHDLPEDHPEYWEIIEKEFPLKIIIGLRLLTRIEGESYFDFIMKIGESQDTSIIKVKIQDLIDNMRDLKESSKKDKYRFAYYILKNRL